MIAAADFEADNWGVCVLKQEKKFMCKKEVEEEFRQKHPISEVKLTNMDMCIMAIMPFYEVGLNLSKTEISVTNRKEDYGRVLSKRRIRGVLGVSKMILVKKNWMNTFVLGYPRQPMY